MILIQLVVVVYIIQINLNDKLLAVKKRCLLYNDFSEDFTKNWKSSVDRQCFLKMDMGISSKCKRFRQLIR